MTFLVENSDAPDALRVGLVNNMPDPALRRTEQQFRSLLGAAIEERGVHLTMTTLPDIERVDWAAQHVAEFYVPLDEFVAGELDAIIITGAEPRARELSDEPYWRALTSVFDWVEDARVPAAYCCLAAHAAVLHRDGIRRRPLAQKCLGVFEHEAVGRHPFLSDVEPRHVLPHSRWNEIVEADLVDAGYVVLDRSEVGVGAFARDGDGIDLYFQGHPEYGGTTLLREYRRDVRRFLTRERDVYPQPPFHGINEADLAVFLTFEERARRDRREALFEEFPSFAAADARATPWRPNSARIYRNWLESVAPARSLEIRPALERASA